MNIMYLGIDNQYGFCEGGHLPVEGGKAACEAQADYLKNAKGDYKVVGETADWHPITHCSFLPNGGVWNPHCVQFSHDAAIYDPLLEVLLTCPNFEIFTKGTNEDREEYSVFKNEKSRERIIALVKSYDIEEIHVGGIAYDYCVQDTVKDGLRCLPDVKFKVFKNFCPFIAKETADQFTKFISETERVTLI